jgi:hypothetical protein
VPQPGQLGGQVPGRPGRPPQRRLRIPARGGVHQRQQRRAQPGVSVGQLLATAARAPGTAQRFPAGLKLGGPGSADAGLTRALLYVALTRGREANYAYVITESRTADLRSGTGRAGPLSPAQRSDAVGEDDEAPDAASSPGPWVPPADRLSVLIAALERENADLPALEVLRDELTRAGHLAHLGAIWADLAAEESGRGYDATLQRVLSDEHYEQYATAEARSTLHRLVRSAELAGYNPGTLLARAAQQRSLTDAEDIARVLHSRVREITGDLTPRPASYAERTPEAADPQVSRYLQELARLMDERTAELGEGTAAEPPAWALNHLGAVPDDPLERQAWSSRAGTVAAYREHYGRTDSRDRSAASQLRRRPVPTGTPPAPRSALRRSRPPWRARVPESCRRAGRVMSASWRGLPRTSARTCATQRWRAASTRPRRRLLAHMRKPPTAGSATF